MARAADVSDAMTRFGAPRAVSLKKVATNSWEVKGAQFAKK
jgi:hypothetical protein